MEKNQKNKQPKKNRQVKFEDVLAMYKLIKDIYADLDIKKDKMDELENRIKILEKVVTEKLLKEEKK